MIAWWLPKAVKLNLHRSEKAYRIMHRKQRIDMDFISRYFCPSFFILLLPQQQTFCLPAAFKAVIKLQ